MLQKIFSFIFIVGLLLWLGACQTKHEVAVAVAPVEVKPIHITIDVNVKIDRALDDFFGDIDKAEEELEQTQSK
jgi:hypothetical protein